MRRLSDATNYGNAEQIGKSAPTGSAPLASGGIGGAPGTIESPPDGKYPTILELYRAHRDYLNHEHDLINQRLGWNFTIQGFLFAARGLVLGKLADIAVDLSQKPVLGDAFLQRTVRELRFASFIVTFGGFWASVAVVLSVWAALRSMQGITSHWDEFSLEDKKLTCAADAAGLPGIIGGGDKTAVTIGFYAPLFLPTVLGIAWLFLLFH